MSRPRWQRALLGLAAVAWGASVLIAYYMVHKPVTLEQAQAVWRLVSTLAGWVGTLALGHWLGCRGAPFLADEAAGDRLGLRLGLGLGILGWAALALGAVGGYWPPVAWVCTAAGMALGLRGFVGDLRAALPGWPAGAAQRALALFVALVLTLTFFQALTPPAAWDSLVYHLTGPKLYIQAHGLRHDVDIPYLGFPQWGSMLFTWAMLLAGPQLAQLMHFTFVLLTLLLLPSLARRVVPGRGWLAAALVVSVPTAMLLAGWAYVEWLTMFAGLAAFVSLHRAGGEQGGWRWPALAGLFAGLALAAKYTAAGLVAGIMLLALARLGSSRRFAVVAVAGMLSVAPYLAKNLLLTGNPVYPFFFDGKFWDEDRRYWYSRPGTGLNAWQLLIAPWEATVWGLEGATVADRPPYSATIGPLLLALVPLNAVGWRERPGEARRELRGLLLVAVAAYLAWSWQLAYSMLLVQTRLLLPALPFLAILAASGLDALSALKLERFSPQFVIGGLVAAVLALSALEGVLAFATAPPLPVVAGGQSEGGYLRGKLGWYAVAIEQINQLPPKSKVVFLWEPRSYYCSDQIACEPDSLLDRWWHLRLTGASAAEIALGWRAAGATHVLIFETGRAAVQADEFDPLTAQDWSELQAWRAELATLVADLGGSYQLYALGSERQHSAPARAQK